MERHVCTAALLLLAIVGVMAGKTVTIGPNETGKGETTLADGDSFALDNSCKRIVLVCKSGSCPAFTQFATSVGLDVSTYTGTDAGFEMTADWRTSARTTINALIGSGKAYETIADFNTAGLGRDVSGTEQYLVSQGSCLKSSATKKDFQIWAAAASRGSLLLVWAVCLLMTVMQFGKNSYE